MNSIKILVAEHNNILRMLDVVHAASLRILEGAPVNTNDFWHIIDFIRKYSDKTHHGKEEAYLFKVMVDELGAMGENLVSHGMMVEHDIARLYVSDLEAGLKAYEAKPTDEARLSIMVAAGSYEQLLRRHIQKENDAVFPFGEKSLSDQSARWVEDQVSAFESDAANAEQREYQLSILSELEKRYVQ
ncbi:hemerythrin domain-containing protein [Ruminococcaceae bacterium OttesenSCG-928-I18]|nr:hemerythrin domain-containing protein [Ruminococcaceae bacterium OttesenSCG-928-I18]